MKVLPLLLLFGLTGCASGIPKPIRTAPDNDIPLAQVLKSEEAFRGAGIRWGGTIASIENRQDETWLEIVERPLDSDGQPQSGDRSSGRFLARVDGFLDPAIFAPKRQVTVAGTLEGSSTHPIGEHPYTFPRVKVEHVYLWPRPTRQAVYYHSPFWYDPWYPWGWGYPYPHRHPRR